MEEVLNRILSELKELKDGQDELRTGQTEIRAGMDELRLGQVRLEDKFDNKIKALFDDRDVQNEKIAGLVETVERIEAKVDVLQMETAQLRRIK